MWGRQLQLLTRKLRLHVQCIHLIESSDDDDCDDDGNGYDDDDVNDEDDAADGYFASVVKMCHTMNRSGWILVAFP